MQFNKQTIAECVREFFFTIIALRSYTKLLWDLYFETHAIGIGFVLFVRYEIRYDVIIYFQSDVTEEKQSKIPPLTASGGIS